MKKVRRFFAGKARAKRAARDKRMLLAGTVIGAALSFGVSTLLGKLKCRNCVKRMLAEKK